MSSDIQVVALDTLPLPEQASVIRAINVIHEDFLTNNPNVEFENVLTISAEYQFVETDGGSVYLLVPNPIIMQRFLNRV